MTSHARLQVAMIWRGSIIGYRLLSRRRKVTVGPSKRATFVTPALEGRSKFLLLQPRRDGYVLHLAPAFKGELHLDGEYLGDCWSDENLALLGQFRDTPIRVRDGDAVGYGIMESLIGGVWPELGLTEESDHKVSYT